MTYIPIADGRPLFEFRNLRAGHFERGVVGVGHRRIVVDGVTMSFRAGEIIGIVGGNASGKSTIIRAIVDSRSRFAGDVLCDGNPLSSSEIAYVPQSPALTLSPWNDVFGELAMPLRIRGMQKSAMRAYVAKRVVELGIELPMDRRVEHLSGGQRVRVALSRALMVPHARLLVLDEPFEGLDEASRAGLVKVIRKAAEGGVAVLVTSHRWEDLVALGAKSLRLIGSPVRGLNEALVPDVMQQTTFHEELAVNGDGLSRALIEKGSSRLRRMTSGFFAVMVGLIVGTAAWGLIARVIENVSILPGPLGTARAMLLLLSSPEEVTHLGATLTRASLSLVFALLLAVPLGIIIGADQRFFKYLSPWLSWGRCVPIFALAGSAIGLFPGQPEVQRIFLIWLTLFLIGLQIISVSAAMAPRRRMDLARVFGASLSYRLWRVLLRESSAGIVSALEVSLPTSIIVTLVVETTMLPEKGVGLYLFNHMTDRDLSVMFAYVLIPGAVAAVGVWMIRSVASLLRHEL